MSEHFKVDGESCCRVRRRRQSQCVSHHWTEWTTM